MPEPQHSQLPPGAVVQPLDTGPGAELRRNLTALAENPRSLEALIGAGRAAIDAGRRRGGDRASSPAPRKSRPNDPRVKAGMASAMLFSERPEQALILFAEAVAAWRARGRDRRRPRPRLRHGRRSPPRPAGLCAGAAAPRRSRDRAAPGAVAGDQRPARRGLARDRRPASPPGSRRLAHPGLRARADRRSGRRRRYRAPDPAGAQCLGAVALLRQARLPEPGAEGGRGEFRPLPERRPRHPLRLERRYQRRSRRARHGRRAVRGCARRSPSR